ncbi:MAG: biotin carboxylase N-terminal domain-containing protein, partial [Spirochaetaceae bacterium]
MSTPTMSANARIGIVNRGEPAMRFIRAVKEYNAEHGTHMTTVAFFIPEEGEALFTKEADYAVPFSEIPEGNTTAATPYLNHDQLINGLLRTSCTAVWPGWGFVSEDADFVARVEREGLVFLGPESGPMAALGDKIQAKELAEQSRVPVLPWSKGPVRSIEEAQQMAEQIGYPCILKAANAGGGRGIRFVMKPDELLSQFTSARDETIRITGNDILFMERLVVRGRHLEVQCIADRHGTVATFGVRDCSVQRKNQKIIEETPPPNVREDLVPEMEAAAARLLETAAYTGAGTVEFLYDLDRSEYYFMEVNTRLQVEHCVTEELYGIDLVKGQIDVALGNRIYSRSVEPVGHVMEVRLNAEDPDREFTPAPGYVSAFKPPAGPGIRVDSGVEQGSTIPAVFDSMIAKIIAKGPSRAAAIARLERALRELRVRIESGTTNRSFLLALLANQEVRSGAVHTRCVEQMLADRKHASGGADAIYAIFSCAVEHYLNESQEDLSNFNQQLSTAGNPRDVRGSEGKVCTLKYMDHPYELLVKAVGTNEFHIEVSDTIHRITYLKRDHEALLLAGSRRLNVQTVERGDSIQCEIDGQPYLVEVESSGAVKAPSPSIVLSVPTTVGQSVQKGDVLLSLEAMKMEMIVDAPESGVIREILVKPGEQVAAGQVLLQLEPEGKTGSETADTEPLRFEGPTRIEEDERIRREFIGLFLGYDYSADVLKRGPALLRTAGDGANTRHPAWDVLDIMEAYVALGNLFGDRKGMAEGFARPAPYAELLIHYYKRHLDRERGMPDDFLESLNRALKHYVRDEFGGLDKERSTLLRMFRSNAIRDVKQKLLRDALFVLEDIGLPPDSPDKTGNLLDETAVLCGMQARALGDAAIHARYQLIDRQYLQSLKEERHEQVGRAIELIERAGDRSGVIQGIMTQITDSGHNINAELVRTIVEEEKPRRSIVTEMLARRFNRDRTVSSLRIADRAVEGIADWAIVEASDARGRFVQALAVGTSASAGRIGEILKTTEEITRDRAVGTTVELLWLIDGRHGGVDPEAVFSSVSGSQSQVVSASVGILHDEGTTYGNFTLGEDGRLEKDTHRGPFNPLRYRELRVERLVNFKYSVAYAGEFVTLLDAECLTNSHDQRLFALVEVPSSKFERDETGQIKRMVAFENVFMEAVYAMRAEQAKRARRLQWNRIIVHMRSVVDARLEDIRLYARALSTRAADLGLEKFVLYNRRLSQRDRSPQEVEMLFENISGRNFSLRGRVPSRELLKPIDTYTAKVVRARQRGTVYPYELIKLFTRTGIQISESFPRGDFEEFDIAVENGTTRAVSVRGRPYGQSESNIVFGIITSWPDSMPEGVARVLILSDTTSDMGSLSEAECRRINAALDLAEQRSLPVEWIPVSAGARIDMNSGTENLDWTADTLKRIITFTQNGGEINIIVSGINVGAQSYWNAEATMLMHTRGLLIMTEDASMLLTGKRALDFSGSVSAEDNVGIGGVERIMEPNGQAQIAVRDLFGAYEVLFRHYEISYVQPGARFPERRTSSDPTDRNVGA